MIRDIADERITLIEHVTPYSTLQMIFTGYRKLTCLRGIASKVLVIDRYKKRIKAFFKTR